MLKTNLGRLRVIGFLEGLSFIILLGVAMPLKYGYGMTEAVRWPGMIHGILWVVYLYYIYIVAEELKWKRSVIIWGAIASVLPFGPFVADARLFREKN